MGLIAKQSIRGTIVTYMGVFVGFLTTFFVLTRFLTTEEIGLARVLIDAGTLFIGLAQLGTSSSIIRFYPYFHHPKGESPTNSQTDNGFFFWTVIIPLVGFALFTLLYILLRVPIQALFLDKSPLFVDYYYLVLPLSFFMLYQTIFETNANVLMRIVFPRAVRELILRLFLLATYLLYAFRLVSMDGFVILICLSYGLAALCNIVYLFSYGHISLRPNVSFVRTYALQHDGFPLVRQYLYYTVFQITAALGSVLAPSLSSFFITSQMGLSYTGVFAIATYIAVMVSIPNRSLNAIASPQLSRTFKEGNLAETQRLLRQVATNSLFVGSFIYAFIVLNLPLIFHLLPNGDAYRQAAMPIVLLGLSQMLLAMFNICLSALNFSRLYPLALLYSFVLTLSAIAFNHWLIPIYGMTGAAMANVLSYLLYFVLILLTLIFGCRVHPFQVRQLWIVLLLAVLLLIGWLIRTCLPGLGVWTSALLVSACWLAGVIIALYFRLSPDITHLLMTQIQKFTNEQR